MAIEKKVDLPNPLTSKVRELLSLDLRSLAFFRIAFALLILADLAVRATNLQAHYTDFGILPRIALIEQFSSPWRTSFHLMSGKALVQTGLFLLQAFLAMLFLVGYRTRLVTFLSWIFMISLHARNPMVLQAGDYLFRLLLFWGIFLPLNARYSIDSALNPRPPQQKLPDKVFSMATAVYFFQVAFIYWFTAAYKLRPSSFPIWWEKSLAVYNALNIDQFTLPAGYLLLKFPLLVKFLSRAVIGFEVLGPFFLFSPIYTEPIRFLGVLGFWSLHLGFGSCLVLGPFPWISSITMIPFIPTFVWGAIRGWLEKFKPLKKFASHPTVSQEFLSLFPPPGGRVLLELSTPRTVIVTLAFLFVLFWNIGTLVPKYGVPPQMNGFGIVFGLEQRWNMFSPPLTDDGWYVIPGRLKNGEVVDLFKGGGPVRWEKPARVSKTYKNERWRKYMMNLWQRRNSKHRLYYGRYLCRNWNTRHTGDKQLKEFKICFMRERTLPDYQPSKPERVIIWNHWCFKPSPEEVRKGREHPAFNQWLELFPTKK